MRFGNFAQGSIDGDGLLPQNGSTNVSPPFAASLNAADTTRSNINLASFNITGYGVPPEAPSLTHGAPPTATPPWSGSGIQKAEVPV